MNFNFCDRYNNQIQISKNGEYFHVFLENNRKNRNWLCDVGKIIDYCNNYFVIKTNAPYKFYFQYYYHFQ